jgi:hypothetical protein
MYEKTCNYFLILIHFSIEKCIFAYWYSSSFSPIWPPLLPLNLTYILRFFSRHCLERTCSIYYTSNNPSNKSHIHFLSLSLFIVGTRPGPKFLVIFCNKLIFYDEEFITSRPTPKTWGPHLVCCPRLLIQYIRHYPPYLEGIFSIRNLKTRHAVVTRNP